MFYPTNIGKNNLKLTKSFKSQTFKFPAANRDLLSFGHSLNWFEPYGEDLKTDSPKQRTIHFGANLGNKNI